MMASRAVWIMLFGDLSRNEYICHTCDNPRCVNPRHLYKGTHKTNMADKIGKHRGERATNCKLTQSNALYIKQSRGRESTKSLADFFGISPKTVSNIWRGDIWGWLQ